jgi:hypothetical protein
MQFQGPRHEFQRSEVMRGLVQSITTETQEAGEENTIDTLNILGDKDGENGNTVVAAAKAEKQPPRKFSEEAQRAVGRVAWSV